jgi:membrane-associated protease RseP (regulator of RpoE activity)
MSLRNPALRLLPLAATLITLHAAAQSKIDIINSQGAEAPCFGVGPIGAPLAKKCVEILLQAGFLRVDETGVTGLTFGSTLKDDGRITTVAPGSAAAQAGLLPGDAVVSVEGKPIVDPPGLVAEQAIFGPRGDSVQLKLRKAGDVTLKRAPLTAPPGPKSPSFFIMMRPIIDWRNIFIPCMGAGPAAPAVLAYCDSHFKPFGYIKAGDLGTTGLSFDLTRPDAAIVAAVDPNSPAAAASIQPGDQLLAVDGKPLTPNLSELAREALFGKTGTSFHVTVHRGRADKTLVLTLAAPTKPAPPPTN